MKMVTIIVVAILMCGAFFSGQYLGDASTRMGSGEGQRAVSIPQWTPGDYWDFAFDTPEIRPTIARIVVATKNESQYQLGIDNRLDAQRHAVLNYNPMLGRVTCSQLEVFEKGVAQKVLQFPLRRGNMWNFTLMGREDWLARVVSVDSITLPIEGKTVLVSIEAKSTGGDMLNYSYDSSARWFRSMVLKDAQGNEELRMTLVAAGTGFTGDAYFVRGVDLYKKEAASSTGSPEVDVYESFIDRGHPTWGPFDSLIYYYRVEIGTRSNGILTFRDHSTTTIMRKTFDPGTLEDGLGSMPSSGGEVGITIVLQGDCSLVVMVAGGIEYKWTV
jgi:hypothetical protein